MKDNTFLTYPLVSVNVRNPKHSKSNLTKSMGNRKLEKTRYISEKSIRWRKYTYGRGEDYGKKIK